MDLVQRANFVLTTGTPAAHVRQPDGARKTAPERPRTLALCMIVKNEEEFLPGCLESVAEAVDEIVIVDTGSTDGTIEIARRFTGKIFHFPWTGDFSAARNAALEHVTCDWVLQLDADEVLSPDPKAHLRRIIQRDDLTGFLVKLVNHLPLPDGQEEILEHHAIRLFPRHPDVIYSQPIHEQISLRVEGLDGLPLILPLDRLLSPIVIHHFGYNKEVVKGRGKTQRNVKIIEGFLREERKNGFQHFNLGLSFSEEGRYEEAMDHFREAERLENPLTNYYPMIFVYASKVSALLGRLKEAEKQAKDAMKHAPKLPDAAFQMGETLRLKGDLDGAIDHYRKAVEIAGSLAEGDFNIVSDPGTGTWKPYNQMGALHHRRGEWEKARECLEEAARRKPDSPMVLGNLGRTHRELGNSQEAEKFFLKAYHLSWQSTHEDLVYLYLRQQRWDDLNLLLGTLREKLPLTDWLRFESMAALSRGEWPRARTALETLAASAPSAAVWHDLGLVCLNLGEADQAREAFERALALDPAHHASRHKLALLLFMAGSVDQALALLEEIPVESQEGLAAHLTRANILVTVGRHGEALPLLLDLNKRHPESPEVLLKLGYTLFQLKADAEAYEVLMLVLPCRPDDLELHLKLGLVTARLGRFDEAKTFLARAGELDPSSNLVTAAREAITVMASLKPDLPALV